MLPPDSRTIAFGLLRPPADYKLDFALLTTYTLELEALLALPLSLIARSDQGLDDLLADPLLLQEALRRAGEQIHVFVDRAGIAIPSKQRELYALLEPSIHPVRAPGGGTFHPKVWVLRFVSTDGATLVRVAVLSRNLTFDRSWDIALATESSPTQEHSSDESRALAELIRHLPKFCAETPTPSVLDKILGLAEEVSQINFPAPEGFFDEPITFHVFGLDGERGVGARWPTISDGRDVLAVAPFIGSGALKMIAGVGAGKRTLVSTREQLDKVSENTLAEWSRVLMLSDAALDENEDDAGRPSGLHAKFIAVEQRWDVTWYIGSANLTYSAFSGRNIEVMAAVSGRKGRRDGNSGFGIGRFLESGFEKLCEPYQRGDPQTEKPTETEALKRMEAVRDALLDADLKIVCSPSGESWTWNLVGSASFPNTDVRIEAWPISLPEERAAPLELPLILTLPVQRLTKLVAFRLHVPVAGVDDLRLTLSLAVEGIPDDRAHHVLRSLIDNPARFMAFIRALLGGLEGMIEWARDGDAKGEDRSWATIPGEETILEGLIRAASRDPDRLEPVRRLIQDFRSTEEGRRIVPDDFLEIWNAVEEVLREDDRS